MTRSTICLAADTLTLRTTVWPSYKGNGAHGVMTSKIMKEDEKPRSLANTLAGPGTRTILDDSHILVAEVPCRGSYTGTTMDHHFPDTRFGETG
jgi:hypothetical protein